MNKKTVATENANAAIPFDEEIRRVAEYVTTYEIDSDLAWQTARHCLLDSLGCAILALNYPACTKMLGAPVEGMTVENGARVPGTSYALDPLKAAFDIGCCVRWLDYNDTWLAAEWGHPSDNLGAILAVADFVSRRNIADGGAPLLMKDVLAAMIKAHEIQGVMALENSFNAVGLDHVVLVKLASTALAAQILGATPDQLVDAISQVWVDGQSLRTYRHAPNTGPRKSWAAGDACRRAVELALITLRGEKGYPGALSTPVWGFYDASFRGKEFAFSRDYGTYVMENILFKISFPAEFHSQTAVEAGVILHDQVKDRIDEIERIELTTHESAIRIISKTGPLRNPADRDHCLQYMVAVALLKGDLTADDYEDEAAADPRIDALREKMTVAEDKRYSAEYLEADKRSIANAVQVFFTDGGKTDKIAIDYPVGHRRRREEGIPLLKQKAERNLKTKFDAPTVGDLMALFEDGERFDLLPVNELMDRLVL